MVGDDAQSAARAEQLRGGCQHLVESLHLVVHLYAQGLEEPSHIFLLLLAAEERVHHLQEVVGGEYGFARASLHYCGGYLARPSQLAVEVEYVGEVFLGVVVHYVGGSLSALAVHAHVERRVVPEREAALSGVEVVARHAKVGKESVDMLHAVIAHPVAQPAEV